ncbi:uncharacterized protein LOC132311956 [Cornus florida]|uniref:uncharacterized protein LOC132311956 n=1 Tax=Cornus florida TaxID=4283 RepID=UPI0028A2D354|nr:uncharacterized protein LOC132311956 [Cornus florida]
MYDQLIAMDEGGSKKNVEAEKLPLIDILSEDDFLVASPFRDDTPEDFRLSDVIGQREQKLLVSSESMEPGRAINFRKSLAWDSAFFTCAGVLDPEELHIINKGFDKATTHILPGIREDVRVRRPADSDSTFDCDGFCLESTELDIFEDIRVSNIQRSSKTSIVANTGIQNIHCKYAAVSEPARFVTSYIHFGLSCMNAVQSCHDYLIRR